MEKWLQQLFEIFYFLKIHGNSVLNKQQEITTPWFCLVLLAVFGPNTCCNFLYHADFKSDSKQNCQLSFARQKHNQNINSLITIWNTTKTGHNWIFRGCLSDRHFRIWHSHQFDKNWISDQTNKKLSNVIRHLSKKNNNKGV